MCIFNTNYMIKLQFAHYLLSSTNKVHRNLKKSTAKKNRKQIYEFNKYKPEFL